MSVLSSPETINRKVSSFLDGKVSIYNPNYPKRPKLLVIRDLIHAILSEIQSSTEIQEACTDIQAVLCGSYLAKEVVALHPVVNDKDLKIQFRLKDGKSGYGIYQKVRGIIAKHLMDQVPSALPLNPLDDLLSIGARKDRFASFKNIQLGLIELLGSPTDLPLEISMVFTDQPYLTHLTNIDSLEVPIRVCGNGLGSEEIPGHFILRSKEGGNIEEILSDLEQKKITSSRQEWDPTQFNYFELARYFIWICEKCTENGSKIFSCFYQGSIEKNAPRELWNNLWRVAGEKRSNFALYPFVLFCNHLFHTPPVQAAPLLVEMKDVFDDVLSRSPMSSSLRNLLYTIDKKLKPNALFLLSCHLPLLANNVVCVDHLDRKHLQCCFSEQGVEFSILIPLLSLEEGLIPWMREVLSTRSSVKRVLQILSLVGPTVPEDRQKFFAYELLAQVLPHLKTNPSLWKKYKTLLGTEKEIQNYLCDLFQKEDENFFEFLALEADTHLTYEVLEKVYPYVQTVSETFQKKYRAFPRNETNICDWMLSLVAQGENRFFEALSFVLSITPEERFRDLICNSLLSKVVSKDFVLSADFSSKYRMHMGSDEEIQTFLISLLPQQEDFFFQVLSFVCEGLPLERQRFFAQEVLGQVFFHLKKNPFLWTKYKRFIGSDMEIQDYLCDLFQNEDRKFFEILSLEAETDFRYEVLEKVQPYIETVSENFQKKYRDIPKNETKICDWLCSLIAQREDRFFEALSFVLTIVPQDRQRHFICNTLLLKLFSQDFVLSPSFSIRYKGLMGSEEEITSFLISLLPQHEDFFFQSLSFVCATLPPEKSTLHARDVLQRTIPLMSRTSPLWGKCKTLLGDEQEIQNWMMRLFLENEPLFIQILSLEKNSSFICELLRQLLPLMNNNISAALETRLENTLLGSVSKSKPWQALCIRSLMESSFNPKCLRILSKRSGVIQNDQISIDRSQFPKLLPTKEKEWLLSLKLSLLFQNSSFIMDALQGPISQTNVDEIKKNFSGIEIFTPIFEDLINKGQIAQALSFLESQKQAWGLTKILAWYTQLFHKTKFASVEALCKEAIREAFRLRVNPWTLYATFAAMPAVSSMIEPTLVTDPISLSEMEKNSCLQRLLNNIPILIESGDVEKACRLATYFPLLGATEIQVAPLLAILFERSSRTEDRQKIVILMSHLAPASTQLLLEHFKRNHPAVKNKLSISSNFPIHDFVFILLKQVHDPVYFAFIVEHLEKLAMISIADTLEVLEQYVEQVSEGDKEKLALTSCQFSLANSTIGQQIFDVVAPLHWSRTTFLPKVWKFVQRGSLPPERKSQFVATALERIPYYLTEPAWLSEMLPYMDAHSKQRLTDKSMEEIQAIFERMQSALNGTSKSKISPSLASVVEEPFISIVWNSIPLYERLIDLALSCKDKFSAKETKYISALLAQAPEGLSQSMQENRKKVAFFCIGKLRSVVSFSWLLKDVATSLEDTSLQEEFEKVTLVDPNASSQFLQEIAAQLESKPKDVAFCKLLQTHLKTADFLDDVTLAAFIAWIQQESSSPMLGEVFNIAQELVLLCLRSKKVSLASGLLNWLYRDLDSELSLELFQSRYLCLISELFKQYPSFVKNEHLQILAQWIANRNTQLDDSKVQEVSNQLLSLSIQMTPVLSKALQNCLQDLCPVLDLSADSLRKLALLRKNYLSSILTLPAKDLKGVDLSFLDPVEQHLLAMQTRFTHKRLLYSATDITAIYMKAHQEIAAKTWVAKWMSLQNGATEGKEAVEQFYSHRWLFLRTLAAQYPTLVDESLLMRSMQYIQSMSLRFASNLLLECKREGIVLATRLNPEWGRRILTLTFPTLDGSRDDEQKLQSLITDTLGPLLILLKERGFQLTEDFFNPLLDYLLAMKARMPLSEDLYRCLQSLALLSKYHQCKVTECMNALCPDLDAESQDMDRIPLLHQYYVPFLVSAARDCEHYIDQKKLEDLVNCIIRMNESGVPGDISKISRDVLAVCVQCELLDLARILVEGIHKKRMLQFWKEKKSIDVSEDLGAYLGYCIVPEPEPRAPILSTEDLIQILKEHKTRAPVAGIPSFHEILDVFVKEVRRIHEGGRSSPALFHRISVISQFLLSEEPISQQVIQLIYYAFQCPWTDYCFHTFLNLSRALQLKMEEQKLTSSNVPGAPYFITNENAISRIVHNFHETDFKVGSELVSFTVREFILFFYSLYRKTSDPKSYIFFRGILIQALQKIVKEKPSWAASCILDLLSRFREDVFTFQGFIRDLDVPQSAKNGLMVSLGL